VEESYANEEEYSRRVLDAYRKTPGTTGTVRRPDRLLAAQLHQRGVPVVVIENGVGDGTTAHTAPRLPGAGHDSLVGLLCSGHRRSAPPARQPRLRPISPPQDRTCRPSTLGPGGNQIPFHTATTQRACCADDIADPSRYYLFSNDDT
jgi:hypothetical protein